MTYCFFTFVCMNKNEPNMSQLRQILVQVVLFTRKVCLIYISYLYESNTEVVKFLCKGKQLFVHKLCAKG